MSLPDSTPERDAATARYLAAWRVRDALAARVRADVGDRACDPLDEVYGPARSRWCKPWHRACALMTRALIALVAQEQADMRAGRMRSV